MDFSKKIIENTKEISDLSAKKRVYDALNCYSREDKVDWFENVIQRLREKESGNPIIIRSNYQSLDEITGGFRPGQIVVLSAPTGQGKTQFLQELTRRFDEQKINCVWFSYEIPPLELAERFGNEWPKFVIPHKIQESRFDWFKERSIESVAKFGTRVVFIDHLHYLLEMKKMAETKNISLFIGMILRELKIFAIEHGLTIFLVSHLKMTDFGDVPKIDDLRDSSFVAQTADFVMLMWRKTLKDKNEPTGFRYLDESVLYIAKNRWNGKFGILRFLFDKGRFYELENNKTKDEYDPFRESTLGV